MRSQTHCIFLTLNAVFTALLYLKQAFRIAALYSQNNPSINSNTKQVPWTESIDIRLIIITYSHRPWSLQILLTSLNQVEYLKYKVVIEEWIDW